MQISPKIKIQAPFCYFQAINNYNNQKKMKLAKNDKKKNIKTNNEHFT